MNLSHTNWSHMLQISTLIEIIHSVFLLNCSPSCPLQSLNSNQVQTMLELISKSWLRHHICWIIYRGYLLNSNSLSFNDLSDKVHSDIDVLSSFVIHRIPCQMYGILTIAVDCCFLQLYTQLINQSLYPDNFLYNFCCCDVLCFSGRQSNNGLQRCFPTNSTNTKSEDIPRYTFTWISLRTSLF